MITPEANVSIRRIPLECLQVKDYDQRYTSMVMRYVELLRENPHNDAGMIRVVPSTTHENLWTIEDGHHKFCAYIIAGRRDALCIVIEEPARLTVRTADEWNEAMRNGRFPATPPTATATH